MSSAPQQSRRHHYVPVFYLRRWETGGRVCQYSRPHRQVVPRLKAPAAAGFEVDLYSVPGLPTEHRTMLEDRFLKQVDQIASDALDVMLDQRQGPMALSPRLRDGWSRFVLSLHHRSPTRLAALKERCQRYVSANMRQYEQLDTSRNPDFWDRDARVVRDQSLCAGVTEITLLMDVCGGAMVTGAAVPDLTPARACC